MNKRTSLLALAIALISAMTTFAGMDYPMKCRTAATLPGFRSAAGWASSNDRLLRGSWEVRLPEMEAGEKKPEPMAKSGLGDRQDDRGLQVSRLPPAVHPASPEGKRCRWPGFDRCPKCGKQTFQVDKAEGIIAFD